MPNIRVFATVLFQSQCYVEKTLDEFSLMLQAGNVYDGDHVALQSRIFDEYFDSVLIEVPED